MMPFSPFSMYYPRGSFYGPPPRKHNVSQPNQDFSNNNNIHELPKETHSSSYDSSSRSNSSPDTQYFDIFGIRLYFDDILILCLLFFLYQEEVNDQLLFIALLLLLLS